MGLLEDKNLVYSLVMKTGWDSQCLLLLQNLLTSAAHISANKNEIKLQSPLIFI